MEIKSSSTDPRQTLDHLCKRLRVPTLSHTPEWQRYLLATEQMHGLLLYPADYELLLKLISAGELRQQTPWDCLAEWFDYWFGLLDAHETLMQLPIFKRFKVSRAEMLDRFHEWVNQYKELSSASGVELQYPILAWAEFLECFHQRKLTKYLAGFWVQRYGLKTGDARRLLELFDLRTKASSQELQSIALPCPPCCFLEVHHDGCSSQAPVVDQVLMLFQPVYDNKTLAIHHCEALMRLKTKSKLHLPDDFFIQELYPRPYILDALSELADHASSFLYPVAVNVRTYDFLDPKFVGALDTILDRLSHPGLLILEFDCQQLAQYEDQVIEHLHYFYNKGCQFSLDNSKLECLPTASVLEFFGLVKPHPNLLLGLQKDASLRTSFTALKNITKNKQALLVAKHVESYIGYQQQKQLGFDLAQGFYFVPPSIHPPEKNPIKSDLKRLIAPV